MKNFRKPILLLQAIVLVTIFILTTGCSEKKDTNPTSNNTAKEKITVVLDWTPNTNHTGLYVAQKMGYYKDAGFDVQIVQPPEDGALFLIGSGKAQFGVSFQEELAIALTSANPLPVIAVASLIQHNTSGIISLKDKNIKTPKDLEGKRYATWDLPLEKAIMKDIIEKDGGDFSKLQMIPNTVTDVITSLKTNIDAVWVYYGWDGIATEVKGLKTNFISFKDINPVFDFYTPLLAANSDYIKNNPDTTRKFLEATAKGYEYAISNPEDAAKILVEYAPEVDKDIAKASQIYLAKQYKAEAKNWGEIDAQRWQAFYNWLYEQGLIPSKLENGKGYTNDYITKK